VPEVKKIKDLFFTTCLRATHRQATLAYFPSERLAGRANFLPELIGQAGRHF